MFRQGSVVAEDDVHHQDGIADVHVAVAVYVRPCHVVLRHVAKDDVHQHDDIADVHVSVAIHVAEEVSGYPLRRDGHVLIGHGECPTVGIVAAEGAGVGRVCLLVAFWSFACGITQRESHVVAVASVIYIIIQNAFAIAGDAADTILSGGAAKTESDVLARRDGASLFALDGAEGCGVVVVGDGVGVAVAPLAETTGG